MHIPQDLLLIKRGLAALLLVVRSFDILQDYGQCKKSGLLPMTTCRLYHECPRVRNDFAALHAVERVQQTQVQCSIGKQMDLKTLSVQTVSRQV